MENAVPPRIKPFYKLLLGFALAAFSLAGFRFVLQSFNHPAIYKKDFLSGYLIAKALQAGVDPYQPIPELARRWTLAAPFTKLDHPTPHTAALGWLCYPFSWLPYEQAAWLWFIFELLCLALALKLLFRGLGIPLPPHRWAVAFFCAFAWMPVIDDLWFGQFNLVLLVLWLGSWLALRAGHEQRGGALLGLLMTLKLAGWPVILWLAWQRRWRSVIAASLTVGLLHAAMIALHGWPLVRDYYFKYGPLVSALYRVRDYNLSLWTFGDRLFTPFGFSFTSAPLLHSPVLAKLTGVGLPLLALAFTLWAVSQIRSFDVGFAALMSVSLLLNPIAWTHYMVALCLTLALTLQRLQRMGWPRAWIILLGLAVGPLCLPTKTWALMTVMLAGQAGADGQIVVPFWAAWFTAVPTLAALGVSWLLWRVERLAQQSAATPWHTSQTAESYGLVAPALPPLA